MMGNTFFGLTTASVLEEARRECERFKCSLHLAENKAQKWEKNFYENNETIEYFQQILKALEAENLSIKAKLDERENKIELLAQELSEVKTWANYLEGTNKEYAETLAKQIDEHNQATVNIAILKTANQHYKEAVKIAADNFILQITK